MYQRKADYPIADLILRRWSPRAMSGESVSKQELMSLFEAARWAPSSFNNQPWRFIYACRDSSYWQPLFDLMVDFNKQWAKDAAVLIFVASSKLFTHNGKPSKTHSYDTGAACQNLALQAEAQGLVAHAIEGFDYAQAARILNIPDTHSLEVLFAIGRPGNPEQLPPALRDREQPSGRNKTETFVFEGVFKP